MKITATNLKLVLWGEEAGQEISQTGWGCFKEKWESRWALRHCVSSFPYYINGKLV